jgi:hypothetical protein
MKDNGEKVILMEKVHFLFIKIKRPRKLKETSNKVF